MSRSDDDGNSAYTGSSQSRSPSKDSRVMPARTVASNVLFLGETDLGDIPIIDLVAGTEGNPYSINRRAPVSDARNVTLDDKTFMLYALPVSANESMSTLTPLEETQKALMEFLRNHGIHLLVYCVNASHSTSWIHHVRDATPSRRIPSPRIPTVAVVSGISDEAEQHKWWSSNQDAFARHTRFDDHAFICLAMGGINGDRISGSPRILRELILRNCLSETSFPQRVTPNPVRTLLRVMSRRSLPDPLGSEPVNVVLLGEIGVGKSSLINWIMGKNVAGVSSDTVACTTTVNMYTFEEMGRTFRLYDTPGLVDPQMGIKDFVDPIITIQREIRSIGNGNGPHLLLFCTDTSKPTAALQRNYRLFYNIVFGGRISSALATTKLGSQGASRWWDHHRATIRELGIDCPYVELGPVKKQLDAGANLEEQLRKNVLSFFTTCTHRTGLQRISMKSIFDSFTAFARSPERILMDQCKLDEHVARELASRLAGSDRSECYA